MADRLAFVLCEHYVNEARKALSAEGLDNAVLAVLPARCGRPQLTYDELAAIIAPLGDADIEVFGGCCVSGLANSSINGRNVRVHKLNSCFELIADPDIINQYLSKGAYLTSLGWLADWHVFMERLGLNKETAAEMFAETTSGIVLLDTGVDDRGYRLLREFAAYVSRPFEVFQTGISVMRLLLVRLVLTWQMKECNVKSEAEIRDLHKQSAKYAMAIDLLANLALISEEEQAVEAMMDVYIMLFAPRRLSYLSYMDGKPDRLWIRPFLPDAGETESVKNKLSGFSQESGFMESGRGFFLRIVQRDQVRGVIAVDEITFPEYIDQYLNLALDIVNICDLPIRNAREYQKLIRTEEMLRKANEDLLHLVTTDSLTGIANRRAYDEYIELEWKRMLRNKTPLSLIVCDIDFFKEYNDLYGHKDGDFCLHSVAQIIRSLASRPGDFAARYGGEEFVVLLPDTPMEGAFHIAEEIRKAVEEYAIPHARSIAAPHVTLSLGVSHVATEQAKVISPAALFIAADDALYAAKRQGRNRTVKQRIRHGQV